MIKILYLRASTSLAGAERVILNFLQYHDTDAFSVHLAAFLNYQRLDNSFTAVLKELEIPYDKISVGNTNLVKLIRQTTSIIKRYSIDILHTHGYLPDFIGIIAAKLTGTLTVSTVHGWTPISLKLRGYEMLDRYCLKRFDRVICVSPLLHKEFSRLGIKDDRLTYLPNAVALPEKNLKQRDITRRHLKVSQQEKLIIAVGRLSPEKGFDLLLRAYAKQFGINNNVRLILVGDGPLLSDLQILSNELGINKRVFFPGFCSDVDKYYAAADLYIMSSHTEGFPMSLLEAMAWGLPVIATAVGGIPDIIQEGENGCLIPPGNIEQLATSMGKILEDKMLAKQMGQLAYQTIRERFAIGKWVRSMENIYSDIFNGRSMR